MLSVVPASIAPIAEWINTRYSSFALTGGITQESLDILNNDDTPSNPFGDDSDFPPYDDIDSSP